MGKETLDTTTHGKSVGTQGSYSTSYQITGRDLMTPEEVRMLDNRYALLFIRGERPVMDEKYDILRHPNISGTIDGGATPYQHGQVTGVAASISLEGDITFLPRTGQQEDGQNRETNFELLSEEDFQTLFE